MRLSPTTETFLVLFAVCLAAVAMPLTFTGTAIALTAIDAALQAGPIALNWVTNAFMLAFGSTLLIMGAMADRFGRRRVFLAGTGIFAILSAVLSVAPTILWLDLLRGAQGVAAAAAISAGMAALAQQFDDGTRLRAFSLVGTSFGVGLAFGPVVSGLVLDIFGWRAIFQLVGGVAAIAAVIGAAAMRESRDPAATALDWPGAVSFTLALTLFTFGVLQAPDSGWTDPVVMALLGGAAATFAAFVAIEGRVERPMLDLTLFRYPRFVGVQLLAAAPAYAYVVLLVLLPLRFTGVEQLDAISAGRLMIALSAPLLVVPLAAGQLTRWFSPAGICGAGFLMTSAGLYWLSAIPVGHVHAAIGPMLIIGLGIGLPWGLMDGLAISVAPKERAGMASGIFNTTRVAGEGVALAIVGAVFSALLASRLGGSTVAAQMLGTGNLAGARAVLPQLDQTTLTSVYSNAFSTLLVILTGITLFTALVVFFFLGRGVAQDIPPDPAPHAAE